ncbi:MULTISPECIES: DUF1499 domain-containing protein [Psychrilyobacter]|uniref:DUF1499 domain-containing protein n=1 Tax=Psychrilyobacter piezotolerans TaxID=2293438 RepID=A0ABX9KJQ1_9FUSO|nr:MULTISPECIES: DUF1499 domain-containing protein [Psychrilyobacter]MCS5421221.1 DUF1499 domain-containing protein [Psychrilyobacter sp. S5]NDI77022.1 DUF1499 domain-containing protein [Psychrilyobacter piezotolerans]RDE64639.1 DUF1499 domain-containing protein [Psychrilyobacter sp. S5]REI42451.1 DUF1499 domain-containing protein [Psychrilyobacter piezotolerans]
MKYILILSLLLLVGCASAPKKETGIIKGKFYPCPSSPNCVSSMAPEGDPHYIEPILYNNITRELAVAKIIMILETLKNTTVVEYRDEYIRAEVRSSFFKFIDDVEFYFPKEKKIIHVRSLARSGYSDFGVNRKRMEKIRVKFYE